MIKVEGVTIETGVGVVFALASIVMLVGVSKGAWLLLLLLLLGQGRLRVRGRKRGDRERIGGRCAGNRRSV